MKIEKKLIKELVDYLSEFNLTEIEYQEGTKKVKVAKNITGGYENHESYPLFFRWKSKKNLSQRRSTC